MSTPLDLAVAIAGALSRYQGSKGSLNPGMVAAEISRRHSGTGYTDRDIADALAEEGAAAGLKVDFRSL